MSLPTLLLILILLWLPTLIYSHRLLQCNDTPVTTKLQKAWPWGAISTVLTLLVFTAFLGWL